MIIRLLVYEELLWSVGLSADHKPHGNNPNAGSSSVAWKEGTSLRDSSRCQLHIVTQHQSRKRSCLYNLENFLVYLQSSTWAISHIKRGVGTISYLLSPECCPFTVACIWPASPCWPGEGHMTQSLHSLPSLPTPLWVVSASVLAVWLFAFPPYLRVCRLWTRDEADSPGWHSSRVR